jgi:hypothetical protein
MACKTVYRFSTSTKETEKNQASETKPNCCQQADLVIPGIRHGGKHDWYRNPKTGIASQCPGPRK